MKYADMTLADLVLELPTAAAVLSRHRLDFCCRGARTLRQAAAEADVSLDAVIAELADTTRPALRVDPRSRSTASLVAHIIGAFHDPLRHNLPTLLALSEKVARVHGAGEPTLVELQQTLSALAAALLPHLDREELDVFPRLMAAERGAGVPNQELELLLHDHDELSVSLRALRRLTRDFQPAAGACASYRSLFEGLRELEQELFAHVHLENNVLFPRFRPRL